MKPDPITLADEAEERSAADALRAARTQNELMSIWWTEASHFKGAAQRRLRNTYLVRWSLLRPHAKDAP